MAGMSTSVGLISGMDTASLISQLMQVEANPQTFLKNKLVATTTDASGYRAVNLRFDSLKSAAAALATDAAWTGTKATSSHGHVTASSAGTAEAGSVSFAVTQMPGTHTVVSNSTWGARTTPVRDADPAWPITIRDKDNNAVGQVDVGPTATLADAAAAVNAANLGVKAAVIQLRPNEFRLQFTSTTGGESGRFSVESAPKGDGTAAAGFAVTAPGQDAVLDLGGGLTAASATGVFADLLPGVTITATKADPQATVTVAVAKDSDALTGKVQALVDAANNALQVITDYTAKDSTTATLKGDGTLRGLAGRILDIVSSGIGGASAATVGIGLTKDGKLTFDKAAFGKAVAADPVAARKFLTETTGSGATAQPVGLAAQLEALAKSASDTTTGSLTTLAKSSDNAATDLKARIADWDRRLTLRRENLTRQFTAMETALGTLQNQSSWLSGQLAGLPKWS